MNEILSAARAVAQRVATTCRVATIFVVAGINSMAGCAQQHVADAAQTHLRTGNYEAAIQVLEDGLKTHPNDVALRARSTQVRTDAVARLIGLAASARAEGRYDEADLLLRRAIVIQPGDPRLEALITGVETERRLRAALTEALALTQKGNRGAAMKVVTEALKSNPRHSELLSLQRRLEVEERQAQLKASHLSLAETRPISLDFRDASLRTVLDVVSRNSGINFILDKDIRADTRVTVFLRSARVEDAIDLITSTYQLTKKVIDAQTLLIYPNTPEKQREHQEQVVKVFYVSSGDVKGAAAFLKSMLRVRDPYIDERTSMLALRESSENVQLAERLMAMYDGGEPEVLLEVEVVEINTTRLTELGIKFPDTFALTVLPPAGSTGLNLENIRDLTRANIGIAFGPTIVNLRRETGDFNTLANPRIRVKNKEKARILVGDKIPVITTTTGNVGFVSDNVSYIDVGLKLDVEPTVTIDDDVSIRVALEVSSLGSVVKTASGTTAYQIGTRNAATVLRLRDGETQLLAGLISSQDRSDASKVPGLGDLPVLGRLFSSQRDDGQRTELVLSITPRILRNLRRPDVNESELWVGTESLPRLRPVGGVAPTMTSAPAGSGAPSLPTTTQSPGITSPLVLAPSVVGPGPGVPVAPPSTAPTFQWAGPERVRSGETFEVKLGIQSTQPLRGMPLQLSYGKDRLELVSIEEGDFFRQGGVTTSFTKSVDSSLGKVSAGVLRTPASGAVGSGYVLTLRLKALSPGPLELRLLSAESIGLAGPVSQSTVLPAFRIPVE